MENFEANWQELKNKYLEESIDRERIVKVFFEYYFPILETHAKSLLVKFNNNERDPSVLVRDTFIGVFLNIETLVRKEFESAQKLGGYLYTCLLNNIKKEAQKRIHSELDTNDTNYSYNLYKAEFDRFNKASEISQIFNEKYIEYNRKCYELLELLIIEELKYDDLQKIERYETISYSALRKQKERCLKDLNYYLNSQNLID